MPSELLYYPTIEICDESWLKSALLFWDRVHRIVPQGYRPTDSPEIRRAVDAGLLVDIHPEPDDRSGAITGFESFLAQLDNVPVAYDDEELESTTRVHRDKIDSRLYPVLDAAARTIVDDEWIELSPIVARGYMNTLAQIIADRRNLVLGTDNPYAFVVGSHMSTGGNFSDFVFESCEHDGAMFMGLCWRDMVPANIRAARMKDVVDFSQRHTDERLEFRRESEKFCEELSKCQSAEHIQGLLAERKRAVLNAQRNLRDAMTFGVRDLAGSAMIVGLPLFVGALSYLYSLHSSTTNQDILVSMGLAAVGAIADASRLRSGTPANRFGYLIEAEALGKGDCDYDFRDITEQFIND
jgi:hypothetical protein